MLRMLWQSHGFKHTAQTVNHLFKRVERLVAEASGTNFAPNLLDSVHSQRVLEDMNQRNISRNNQCPRSLIYAMQRRHTPEEFLPERVPWKNFRGSYSCSLCLHHGIIGKVKSPQTGSAAPNTYRCSRI